MTIENRIARNAHYFMTASTILINKLLNEENENEQQKTPCEAKTKYPLRLGFFLTSSSSSSYSALSIFTIVHFWFYKWTQINSFTLAHSYAFTPRYYEKCWFGTHAIFVVLYCNVDPEQAGIKWAKNVDRYSKTNNNNNNNENIADGDDDGTV